MREVGHTGKSRRRREPAAVASQGQCWFERDVTALRTGGSNSASELSHCSTPEAPEWRLGTTVGESGFCRAPLTRLSLVRRRMMGNQRTKVLRYLNPRPGRGGGADLPSPHVFFANIKKTNGSIFNRFSVPDQK